MKKLDSLKITALTLFSLLLIACTSEKPETSTTEDLTDDEIFNMVLELSQAPYFWGENASTIHPKTSDSPHGDFKVRYNQLVKDALDADGKLPKGTKLPDGAAIVKEVYNSSGDIDQWAIMYKSSTDKNSGRDWLWTEYDSSKKNIFSITKRGNTCIGCHNSGEGSDRDLTRIFENEPNEDSNNKPEEPPTPTSGNLSDNEIVILATGGAKATFYYKEDKDAYHNPMGNSPHKDKFKVRYNKFVKDVLDADGKIPDGTTLPDGSIIVKEIYKADNNLKEWSIMYKSSKDTNSENGWLWLEVDSSWSIKYSATNKGSACVSCHSTGKGLQRDYTRIFEF